MPSATPLQDDDLAGLCRDALGAAEALLAAAKAAVVGMVVADGRIDPAALEREHHAVHGYAWTATYVEALRQMLHWAEGLDAAGRLGELVEQHRRTERLAI